MKICLINPPYMKSNRDSGKLHMQHIGMGYIASVLELNKYQVDIIECPGQNKSLRDVINQVKEEKYNFIGISVYYTNKIYAFKLVSLLRAYFPEIFICLGGYYPTLHTEEAHKEFNNVDCFVLCEGEYTCLELANNLRNGKDWKSIKGISYLENDKIIINEPREFVADIDNIPFPKRVKLGDDMSIMPIITSRGCYGRCKFCGVKEFYLLEKVNRIRTRSVDNFISEIELIIKEYNPEILMISDETFFAKTEQRKKWLKQFYYSIKKKDIKLDYWVQCRADDLLENIDYIIKAIDHGLKYLFIGIESFVQRQLNYYQKDMRVENNIKALEVAKKLNVKLMIGFMIFDPYVTLYEIRENIDIIRKLDLFNYLYNAETNPFSRCAMLAIEGTVIYKDLKVEGLLAKNDNNYIYYHSETKKYYSYIEKWNVYTDFIVDNKYIFFNLHKAANKEDLQHANDLYREIMETDLNFMETVCIMVMENEPDDEINLYLLESSSLIVNNSNKLKNIFNKYGYYTTEN